MRHFSIEALAPEICHLAKRAGGAIMPFYADDAHTHALLKIKSDSSPLTQADMASHRTILAGLSDLTPKIPVLSEESEDISLHRSSPSLFWLVDPLDGTKEFLTKRNEFTVNIALISQGVPIWGVVFAPALDELFWGGKEFGSFRETKIGTEPIKVSIPPEKKLGYRVIASNSHLNSETLKFLEKLGKYELVQAGSSLKFCRIAEGKADIYPRISPTCEWDTAAAQAVLEGAGGFVYDTKGIPLRYGKTEILNPSFIAASTPLDHLIAPNDD